MNNHQVDFTKAVAERMGNIIPVYDIAQLGKVVQCYDELIDSMQNNDLRTNNAQFNSALDSYI